MEVCLDLGVDVVPVKRKSLFAFCLVLVLSLQSALTKRFAKFGGLLTSVSSHGGERWCGSSPVDPSFWK